MDLSALNVENVETPKSNMDAAKEFFDHVISEIGNRNLPFAKRIVGSAHFTEEDNTAIRNAWYRLRYPEMGYTISFQDDGIYFYRNPRK